MRVFVKVEIPVETGNAAAVDGTLPTKIESILKQQKPEAAYFCASNGKRAGYLFMDLKDPSHIPAIAEPWFLAFNASVEIQPAMTIQDLATAGPAIEQAVREHGHAAMTV